MWGNLSVETTESELRELFCQTGSVETVLIVMDTKRAALKGLLGKNLMGRFLSVNQARPMSSLPVALYFRNRILLLGVFTYVAALIIALAAAVLFAM